MMRWIASLLCAVMVYVAFAFVSLEPDVTEWHWEARACMVLLMIWASAFCATCPAWDWRK